MFKAVIEGGLQEVQMLPIGFPLLPRIEKGKEIYKESFNKHRHILDMPRMATRKFYISADDGSCMNRM